MGAGGEAAGGKVKGDQSSAIIKHAPVELNVLKKEKLISPSLVWLTSRPLNSSPLPTSPSTGPAEDRDKPLASA